MKTSFQRIITRDSIELASLLYESEQPTNKILVHVHGMAGNFYENKFLDYIGKTLTDNGVAFFVFNNRGAEYIKDLTKVVGEKRDVIRIGDTYEKFEECILDIKAAIDFVEDKGFSEIHLSGHSLGGPKVAYYSSKEKDSRLKSVIFLSPADMVGLAKADTNYERDITTAKQMIVEGKGDEIMPFIVWGDAYMTANTYMSIGTEESDAAIFNFYNPNDSLQILNQITVPSLTIMGRNDLALTIPIEQTMERIKTSMKSSPKVDTIILGDADHGYNGYEQNLANALLSWIKEI